VSSLRGIRVIPVTIHADGSALIGLSALAAAGKLTCASRPPTH
jgi:hypothetical protein